MEHHPTTVTTLEQQSDHDARNKTHVVLEKAALSDDARSVHSEGGRATHVPMRMKLFAVLMVSLIGFGSHWSSGVTGAMKSTLKKVSSRLPIPHSRR